MKKMQTSKFGAFSFYYLYVLLLLLFSPLWITEWLIHRLKLRKESSIKELKAEGAK